ncbi:hypothetical protein SAMN04488515_1161 [Cognatiyoonia koreensis]|uniref:Uncharacterized protein n=1 Tax=Cognatiyoonia koreensis TaxID=364200 RepID=A0A1I0PDI7_9RHOB|nr:hypothetical protein [Cognatiyoonia koreensis]SEW12214.1 hypothetical protein SAMN04488515_1161 [Cognatiyoonia koreensis]
MNFAGTSISEIAGAMGRSWRSMRATHEITETDFDPYDPAPALRSDIQELLNTEVEGSDPSETTPEAEALRASEKLEHDTMCIIRGALYPSEG